MGGKETQVRLVQLIQQPLLRMFLAQEHLYKMNVLGKPHYCCITNTEKQNVIICALADGSLVKTVVTPRLYSSLFQHSWRGLTNYWHNRYEIIANLHLIKL